MLASRAQQKQICLEKVSYDKESDDDKMIYVQHVCIDLTTAVHSYYYFCVLHTVYPYGPYKDIAGPAECH